MAWRVAESLQVLLAQLNALAPRRSKISDGSIGDAAHQGTVSDHNPNSAGVVTARDFTHDPAGGLDCHKLAAALVASRDPRIKYVIWQGRILDTRPRFNPWTWQPSSGHYQHLHLSVHGDYDSTSMWSLGEMEGDEMAGEGPEILRIVKDIQGALMGSFEGSKLPVGKAIGEIFKAAKDVQGALTRTYALSGKGVAELLVAGAQNDQVDLTEEDLRTLAQAIAEQRGDDATPAEFADALLAELTARLAITDTEGA